MTTDLKKKLAIPFIIIVGFLAINTDSMVKGINNNQFWRVVVASVSDVFVIALGVGLFYAIRKSTKDQSEENEPPV